MNSTNYLTRDEVQEEIQKFKKPIEKDKNPKKDRVGTPKKGDLFNFKMDEIEELNEEEEKDETSYDFSIFSGTPF